MQRDWLADKLPPMDTDLGFGINHLSDYDSLGRLMRVSAYYQLAWRINN